MQDPLLGVQRKDAGAACSAWPVGLRWAGLVAPRGTKAWMCSVPGSDISPPTKGGYLGEHWDWTMLGVASEGLVSFLSLADMNQGCFSLC